ncbi:riboflavin synthase [Shouchella lonarensis]|uniref:Riboflavin synthase n=1 Tax=Shouchella lonarensis TaxID=1464122 RepID=A0A1G6H8V5_9BACI|nr:riboflavin synthase [Shouchella lonarensis]SDB90584.1 riboflavin synthase alpha chain [Shouchella lonarensis]
MFTGIIEEIGTVKQLHQTGQALRLVIGCQKVLTDVNLGDSIAVNGVCLTVTSYDSSSFTADVMPETVQATTLSHLVRGSAVNLERAMLASSRFGGHIVSGHVDGVGQVVRRTPAHNAVYFEVSAAPALIHYIVKKGSVAMDGTSLTVFAVSETTFTVSIIPHTLTETIIGMKQAGDPVNIECDMIGKYVEKMLQPKEGNRSTSLSQLLEENGFYGS